MDILNGLRPRENPITKTMIGAMNKRILDTISDSHYQEQEKKKMSGQGKDWPDVENLKNPLLQLK